MLKIGGGRVAADLRARVTEDRRGRRCRSWLRDPGGVAQVERVVGVDGGGEKVDAAPKTGGDDDHGVCGEERCPASREVGEVACRPIMNPEVRVPMCSSERWNSTFDLFLARGRM